MNHAGVEFWGISFWFSTMHMIILFVLCILMRSVPMDSCHLWAPLLPLLHQLPFTLGSSEGHGICTGCPQGHQSAHCH